MLAISESDILSRRGEERDRNKNRGPSLEAKAVENVAENGRGLHRIKRHLVGLLKAAVTLSYCEIMRIINVYNARVLHL